MSKDWVKVHTVGLAYNAELIKAVLEDSNIAAIIVDKNDSMHTHLANGSIEIYVSPEQVIRAKHIITKNEL